MYYINESSHKMQVQLHQTQQKQFHGTWIFEVGKVSNTDMIYEISLAGQARAGSKEAVCKLYGLYKDRLYRYALYRLGNPEDAEDAVSECVLAAWQSIGKLRDTSAFGAWIFRILRNCCIKHIKDAVSLRENLETMYNAGEEAQSSGGSDISSSIELAEALSQLSDEEREIVLLSSAGGLTSKEISAITGLTSGAVRSKLSRSLGKMREFLS